MCVNVNFHWMFCFGNNIYSLHVCFSVSSIYKTESTHSYLRFSHSTAKDSVEIKVFQIAWMMKKMRMMMMMMNKLSWIHKSEVEGGKAVLCTSLVRACWDSASMFESISSTSDISTKSETPPHTHINCLNEASERFLSQFLKFTGTHADKHFHSCTLKINIPLRNHQLR